MALYDRKYLQDGHTTGAHESTQTRQSDLSTFIKQTYQLFAASLLAASAGAYVGLGMLATLAAWKWPLFFVWIGLMFATQAVKKKPGINLIMLFTFTFVGGLVLAPLVGHFLSRGAGEIVAQAFILTTVAFGGLSVFAMNTKRDFSTMGKMLFISLVVIIVGGLLNAFVFQSPLMQVGIAGVGAILFSAFILYDTQNIIRGAYETPIEGAIALYLDFFNLFVSLLQILGIFGGDD